MLVLSFIFTLIAFLLGVVIGISEEKLSVCVIVGLLCMVVLFLIASGVALYKAIEDRHEIETTLSPRYVSSTETDTTDTIHVIISVNHDDEEDN